MLAAFASSEVNLVDCDASIPTSVGRAMITHTGALDTRCSNMPSSEV